MDTIRPAIETLIRLFKTEVHPGALLVAPDDVFAVTKTPSVILQGPNLTENIDRRTLARIIEKDIPSLTYTSSAYPRLYHLDFDLVVTTAGEGELLEFQERIARFYQLHPVLTITDRGDLNLTERIPVGGLRRVNLSNLRQGSGRLRLEDCPIFDGREETGPLIKDRRFDYTGDINEERLHEPEG